ncbi:MAG TPA: TetR/AcrR family transcriptional regulator [Streptosporangiaceae bacterium]|jgi:AcrR family transcriptional regulator
MTPTRERVVQAAAELLEEGGTAAVTLREVGRLAGVSHNAPYKHFADKEELLAAVAAASLWQSQARTQRIRRSKPPADAIRQLLQSFVRQGLGHPEMFRLTYGPWRTGSAELGEAADAALSSFVAAVADAQQARALPAGDPDRVAALLLALAHGAVDRALAGHLSRAGKGHADPADLIDDLFAFLTSSQ